MERDIAIMLIKNAKDDSELTQALKYYEDIITRPLVETIKKQEEEIEYLEQENYNQCDVIMSLVQVDSLVEKRNKINSIIKYGADGKYPERWQLLYKHFEKKFHCDIDRRMTRDKNNGTIKKSMNKLEYICETMGMTQELHDLATAVFKTDYIGLLQKELETIK